MFAHGTDKKHSVDVYLARLVRKDALDEPIKKLDAAAIGASQQSAEPSESPTQMQHDPAQN